MIRDSVWLTDEEAQAANAAMRAIDCGAPGARPEQALTAALAAVNKVRSRDRLASAASSAVYEALRPLVGRKDFIEIAVTVRDRREDELVAQVTVEDERGRRGE
ncbi:hypothetical protein I5G67_gp073 [Mycobacterium phage Aminay]|uniref:Uncharacterized protein n=1 Tax=Mycobacterium phage Aminay TaxID=2250291 RepID=A0A345KV57_9CAUD|nr:hypothetical protein I5G67_gp073 [Mycobacterium phage Aminay]AXH46909.1 hypothetical protein SEA_AMINAY_73 [Mycobacterium phage Aminay]